MRSAILFMRDETFACAENEERKNPAAAAGERMHTETSQIYSSDRSVSCEGWILSHVVTTAGVKYSTDYFY